MTTATASVTARFTTSPIREPSGVPPLVSVVIATHFRNHLLQDAIESALDQQYEPTEVIVVDDSGTGHARPVIERYDEVHGIVREENGGWAAAYTDGIRAAEGAYVHLLDDDDYFLPGKLDRSVAAIERYDDVDVVYTGMEQDTLGPVYPDPAVAGDVLDRALAFRTFPCCTITMLIDRSLLAELLPLSSIADDLLLKIELARRTDFEPVDACLVYRRKAYSRKWHGMAMVGEMRRVIDHHAALYDERPAIKREALVRTLVTEGEIRLDRSAWSPAAIACFARASYHADGGRLRHLARCGSAVFGRPGLALARKVYGSGS